MNGRDGFLWRKGLTNTYVRFEELCCGSLAVVVEGTGLYGVGLPRVEGTGLYRGQ